MENKQIIVDGVDVSVCEFYCDKYCSLSNDRNEQLPFATSRSEYSNCMFKQLARKERECEALQMSENEAKEIIAELKAKCDKLKKQVKKLRQAWINCDKERNLQEANSEFRQRVINRYKQTLIEIIRFLKEDKKFARYSGYPIVFTSIVLEEIEKILKENDIEISEVLMTDKKLTKYDLTDDGKGKKYDTGKSMVGALCRVFPRALLGIGKCIEFGTHKYPKPDNWKLVDGAYTRYQDSLMRHYLKFLAGEIRDSETGLLHLTHMAWNCLAVLELYLMEHKEEFDGELFS